VQRDRKEQGGGESCDTVLRQMDHLNV
jgi:hypothetical protein